MIMSASGRSPVCPRVSSVQVLIKQCQWNQADFSDVMQVIMDKIRSLLEAWCDRGILSVSSRSLLSCYGPFKSRRTALRTSSEGHPTVLAGRAGSFCGSAYASDSEGVDGECQ